MIKRRSSAYRSLHISSKSNSAKRWILLGDKWIVLKSLVIVLAVFAIIFIVHDSFDQKHISFSPGESAFGLTGSSLGFLILSSSVLFILIIFMLWSIFRKKRK